MTTTLDLTIAPTEGCGALVQGVDLNRATDADWWT